MIPKRIENIIINSLRGGVVPRVGLPYITVGRKNEIDALLYDTDLIKDGGASFRFIVGKYGSGKSFLLQTIRNYAMDKNFVVADADLSPERRFKGGRDEGLATYRELIRNLSTKTRPEGGALELVLDRFVNGASPDSEKVLNEVTYSISEMVHGFEFSKILKIYYKASIENDIDKKALVCKWLRGEYRLKSEANSELGINNIITDDDWYDYIKLFASFLKRAGYSGMLVFIDELVNIYKTPNPTSRQCNYEKILTMYNDTLQGKAQYLGFIMCGTPQCVEDTHRGIFSYEALKSRLEVGRFCKDGNYDLFSPIIRLVPLSYEEMTVLTEKIADIHSDLYQYKRILSEEDLISFIKTEYSRIGAETNITPREVIRDFISLLDIVYAKPGISVSELLSSGSFVFSKSEEEVSDEFAEFEI